MEYRRSIAKALIFKINFEQTYDYVDWDFLDFVTEDKIWQNIENVDKGCLNSMNFTIIINGRPRELFRASKELSQRDPLSSFLFVFGT